MPEKLIDARWLAPPEPLELTLAALEFLEPNQRLRLLIHCTPHKLFSILDDWNYAYQISLRDDSTFEILIWYKGPTALNSDPGQA